MPSPIVSYPIHYPFLFLAIFTCFLAAAKQSYHQQRNIISKQADIKLCLNRLRDTWKCNARTTGESQNSACLGLFFLKATIAYAILLCYTGIQQQLVIGSGVVSFFFQELCKSKASHRDIQNSKILYYSMI